MKFEFGCAKSLYRKSIHPRVLLGPMELKKLKSRILSGDAKKIMAALRRRVFPLVNHVLTSTDLAKRLAWESRQWSDPGILVRMALDDIALVGVLDEEAHVIEALRRVFQAIPALIEKKADAELSGVAFDLAYPLLPEEVRKLYRATAAELIRKKADRGRKQLYKGAAANSLLGETLSGLGLLLAIRGEPGVENLDQEQKDLVSMFEASMHVAFNPDGYPEEDIGYGTGVASYLSLLAESLRRAGIYDPYVECPRYARFGSAMLHFVQPWGEDLSNTGDHGDDFQQREFVLARQAAENGDRTLLWLLGTLHYTHGKVHPENTLPDYYVEVPLRKGFRTPASGLSLFVLDGLKGEVHPARARASTQFRDRGRGIVSFRSGWGKDDTFVVFDGSHRSPGCAGHWHDSCGHFSLSALGEYFAIDTGRYNIEQSCHNVVLIDGRSGRSTNGEWRMSSHHGQLTHYLPGKLCDFAGVDSSHQHNCYWARRYLGLVKGKGLPAYVWTVEDVNKANDLAEFWWTLHTCPENTMDIQGKVAMVRGWRHGNLLEMHFALPPADSYPKPHTLELSQDVASPSSYKYLDNDLSKLVKRYRRPADMVHGPVYLRPRLIAKVAGYNGRFMSILIPRKKGSPRVSVDQLQSVDNSLAVRVIADGIEDIVIFAYEHNLLEAAEIVGRGMWCVVRRAVRTGRVLAWELGYGTSLSVGGRGL